MRQSKAGVPPDGKDDGGKGKEAEDQEHDEHDMVHITVHARALRWGGTNVLSKLGILPGIEDDDQRPLCVAKYGSAKHHLIYCEGHLLHGLRFAACSRAQDTIEVVPLGRQVGGSVRTWAP